MAVQDDNGGHYFATVPFEAEQHAAAVETQAGMVVVVWLGPVSSVSTTLSRAEAREVALHMVEASQQINEEED
jgi:hypothetical protein